MSGSDIYYGTVSFAVVVIMIAASGHCIAVETISHLTQSIATNNGILQGIENGIATRLLHMRQWTRSLLATWNFGESEIKGLTESRTFGRIRMMRQIMLPMAFIGGFLVAVILKIAVVGLINMFLISKVLILNLALILGKLFYGVKELFSHKYPNHGHDFHQHSHNYPYLQNYYGPTGLNSPYSGSFSHAQSFASSRADQLPIHLQHFNQQPFQPQLQNFGLFPQNAFIGIPMQALQQTNFQPDQYFNQLSGGPDKLSVVTLPTMQNKSRIR